MAYFKFRKNSLALFSLFILASLTACNVTRSGSTTKEWIEVEPVVDQKYAPYLNAYFKALKHDLHGFENEKAFFEIKKTFEKKCSIWLTPYAYREDTVYRKDKSNKSKKFSAIIINSNADIRLKDQPLFDRGFLYPREIRSIIIPTTANTTDADFRFAGTPFYGDFSSFIDNLLHHMKAAKGCLK